MGTLVEAALRAHLDRPERTGTSTPDPVRLTSLDLGAPLVDVSDREALYQTMEGR